MKIKKHLIILSLLLFLPMDTAATNAGVVPEHCSIPFADRTETDGNDYDVCEEFYIQTDPTTGVEVYEGEFVTSEGTYNRIYYDHELENWFGVVHIDAYEVVDASMKSATWINLKFSRELKSLRKIMFEYTSEEECEHFGIFGICIGGLYKSEVFYEEVLNTVADGAWNENLLLHNDDIIEYTHNQSGSLFNPGDYDYTVYLHEIPLERQIDQMRVVGFDFQLTDAEVIQLSLDIEDQYAYEVGIIAEDNTLTFEEKEDAIQVLNAEYNALPELEFDMYFSQLCNPSDPKCFMITEDISGDETTVDELFEDPPGWLDAVLDNILSTITVIVAAIAGVSIAGIVAYKIVSKGISVTGEGSLFIIKNFFKGCYEIASLAFEGLNVLIFTPIGNAYSAYPKILWIITVVLGLAFTISTLLI